MVIHEVWGFLEIWRKFSKSRHPPHQKDSWFKQFIPRILFRRGIRMCDLNYCFFQIPTFLIQILFSTDLHPLLSSARLFSWILQLSYTCSKSTRCFIGHLLHFHVTLTNMVYEVRTFQPNHTTSTQQNYKKRIRYARSRYLKCIFDLRGREPPIPLVECGIRRALCLVPAGSSRNEIRSRGVGRCSSAKCPAKSSVTKLGSPPGSAAQIGQTTSTVESGWSAFTCSCRAVSVKPILPQNGHVNDWDCSALNASPP